MRALLLVAIVALPAVAARAEPPPIDFGFTSEDGRRLLVFTPGEHARFAEAICQPNVTTPIRFVAAQAKSGDASRHTAPNFERLAGDVYALASAAPPNQTCVLTTLARSHLDVAPTPRPPCADATTRALKKAESRPVKTCSRLARVDGGGELFTAVFARRGASALAVVGYRAAARMSYVRHTADCKKGAPSCWRVDDGGQWSADDFGVLAVLGDRETPLLVYTWGGAEGENAIVQPTALPVEKPRHEAYRYWSPE